MPVHKSDDGCTLDLPHTAQLPDQADTATDSDASTLIARPSAAYISSPYIFERNPTAMPGPLEELTPPPSPGTGTKGPSQKTTRKGHKSGASLSMSFPPLLTRASHLITPRSSANPSPTRQDHDASPRSFKESSIGSMTPTEANNEAANRFSRNLTDLFQFQGSSAPVCFGISSTSSPKRNTPGSPPAGSAVDGRPSSVGSAAKVSPHDVGAGRPDHVRRGSTLSVAASFLGLATQRTQSTSPVRKSARARTRLDDEITRLDFENEVFPNDSLGGKGERAFDELLVNAEKLFNKMQAAYTRKCQSLVQLESSRQANTHALEESRERFEHVKRQLNEMAAKLEERDAEIKDLEDELEERVSRARTVRMLSPHQLRAPSQSSDRVKKIWSAEGDDTLLHDENEQAHDESERESALHQLSRSLSRSPSIAPAEASGPGPVTPPSRPVTTFWQDAAPYLPPEAALLSENNELKRRIGELEATLQSCLGLVDL